MSLSTGAQIGPYTIGDEIGSGGMGVVYRATDQNLKRDVAVKALPESFSEDADWVARFEREAQTLAALNHPNIAQIYGLERADRTTALAMELVEGPTLADRIADGPLPPDEALGIAMQVADALEAAHGHGIVHRDLKPANIKLRADGIVKVLDFGIAKTLDIRAASGQPAAMTTPAMTQTGIILGTAAYMSPEQARGRPIDQRTDIWAFGCLLYEMLTGQPAFAGEDVAMTLARILANDTNMKSLPGMVSPAVSHAIELCLRKDARKRIADIRDVRLALEGAFESTPDPKVGSGTSSRSRQRRAIPLTATAVVAAFVGFVSASFWPEPLLVPMSVNRFTNIIPDDQQLTGAGTTILAVSPNGRHFAYGTADGFYLRAFGELTARLIPGTDLPPSRAPFFSPDGQWLAYFTVDGRILRIAISGGAPAFVASFDGTPMGADWAADNTILFGQTGGIFRVPATGGIPEQVIAAEPGEALYGPQLLPDGETVLFTLVGGVSTSFDRRDIVAESLLTGERVLLIEGGDDARYLPTGHIVYSLDGDLFGVQFDAERLVVAGGPVPLVQDVLTATQNWGSNFGIAEDGTLVYFRNTPLQSGRIPVWVDRDGREEPLNVAPRNYTSPRISPDGSKIALNPRDQDNDIWIWDVARETLTRLTFEPGGDTFPLWSPDGQRIAHYSNKGGTPTLVWRAWDGSGPEERLAEADGQIFPTSFLPDGSGILVYGAPQAAGTDDDIKLFSFADGAVTPLLTASYAERMPELSPDGNWLAYVSNESGREEVYVRPFPEVNAGGRFQISTDGGTEPLWARDGRELFYVNGNSLLVTSVDTQPGFAVNAPTEILSDLDLPDIAGGRSYDVSLDNTRFLMLKNAGRESSSPEVVIVQNWFEELKQLVSTN